MKLYFKSNFHYFDFLIFFLNSIFSIFFMIFQILNVNIWIRVHFNFFYIFQNLHSCMCTGAALLVQICIPTTFNSLSCQKVQFTLRQCLRSWFVKKGVFISPKI